LTRLTTADIKDIPRTIETYDAQLRANTGATLADIARDAAGARQNVRRIVAKRTAAIVPITAGKGVIEGFCDAVAAVLKHLGIKAFVTRGADIVGIVEAFERNADLIFAADDDRFVAINLGTRCVIDNATSTAKAYVVALERMAKGLRGKLVLVIGVGKVGAEAVAELIRRGAKPLVIDADKNKLEKFRRAWKGLVEVGDTLNEAMRRTSLVINAAPARNMITSGMITDSTMISAPAMPHGLTRSALRKLSRRNLVHDPLHLGVAAMAIEVCI
jgi:pyrrolysine biosynthesis protein PylD